MDILTKQLFLSLLVRLQDNGEKKIVYADISLPLPPPKSALPGLLITHTVFSRAVTNPPRALAAQTNLFLSAY